MHWKHRCPNSSSRREHLPPPCPMSNRRVFARTSRSACNSLSLSVPNHGHAAATSGSVYLVVNTHEIAARLLDRYAHFSRVALANSLSILRLDAPRALSSALLMMLPLPSGKNAVTSMISVSVHARLSDLCVMLPNLTISRVPEANKPIRQRTCGSPT